MSTNYSAAINPCKCCGRGEQSFHIGKSFRTLRAYRHGDGPFGASIKSLKDWEIVLVRADVSVMDEYGDMQDKAKFISEWRRRGRVQMSYEQQMRGGYTRDPEGFILYGGEFS